MFYVYVLKSSKDEELHVGSTNDLKRRIKEHQSGKSFATKLRTPFELIYYEAYKKEGIRYINRGFLNPLSILRSNG